MCFCDTLLFLLMYFLSFIVVSSGHSGALFALFFPLEYIPKIYPHSTYIKVNGVGWFQGKERPTHFNFAALMCMALAHSVRAEFPMTYAE